MRYLFKQALVVFFLSFSISITAQTDKLAYFDIQPTLLSFQKTRLSAGLNVNYGYATLSPKPTNFVGGSKLSVGLLFNIYSPLSITSFVTGVNYSLYEHKFGEREDKALLGDSIQVTMAEVPFYLKFKFGSLSSKYKFTLMPGVAYNFVQQGEIKSDFFPTIEDKNLVKNFLDYRIRLGCEIALGRQSKKAIKGNYVSDARTRLVVYLEGTYARSPLYNEDYASLPDVSVASLKEIGTASPLTFQGGVTVYFTLGEWGKMGDDFIDGLKD